jgi:transposase-like protein
MKRHGAAKVITTDGTRSYKAAMTEIGNADKQEVGRWANRMRTHTSPSNDENGNAEVQADEYLIEIQLCPRRLPQSLQSGPPPYQPRRLQSPMLSRLG